MSGGTFGSAIGSATGSTSTVDIYERQNMHQHFSILRLRPAHIHYVAGLQTMFGRAFEDEAAWHARRPDSAYLAQLFAKEHVIVLAAVCEVGGIEAVVGGLVAYELPKIEEARSEIYIYDLAVDETHRRRGIATALIRALQPIAHACGAWVIYVQADYGDEPAIALYTKLGVREDVMHFDIPIVAK
jgi:aminoglycoside 3-N-acetyltransferase I